MDEETQYEVMLPGDLLVSLVDQEDCDFDHHGGCQAHGYLSLEPGETCPQQSAKNLLDEYGIDWR